MLVKFTDIPNQPLLI